MITDRRAGILCHPTSLPSPFGIGDLGQGCDQFLAFCHQARQRIWQVLPLGPTGYGDSPYQPFSAFAGNHLLIDPLDLCEMGLLHEQELNSEPALDADRVEYGEVIGRKSRLLRIAFDRWESQAPQAVRKARAAFEAKNEHWLPDYCLFMALKQEFNWAPWSAWPRSLAQREPEALRHWQDQLASTIAYQRFLQFLFDRQWQRVRAVARKLDITIIGDIPIFVGHDSADVWANQHLFHLDDQGAPTIVAGVPPDYFSPTGQLWGNPHYRWTLMAEDGYAWWMARLRRCFEQVDLVRLDHFRGFSGYWEIPAGEKTAINGRWVQGVGKPFFDVVEETFGELPIIAEDLGVITRDVVDMRLALGLPGMKVLQFAFDSDASNPDLPHNYETNCIVYSGTHDNDTTVGWYGTRDDAYRHKVRTYVGDDHEINWAMIRLALTSVADTAVYPLQDLLGLGNECRMNFPGQASGNWGWRFRTEALTDDLAQRLADLTTVTGRWFDAGEKAIHGEPMEMTYQQATV